MTELPPAVTADNAGAMAGGRVAGTAEACEAAGEPGLVSGSAEDGAMSLLRMEEKFAAGQYRSMDDFAADFRSVLSGCYRLHGAEHWLSRQARRLEALLEHKLAPLSRNLQDKTQDTSASLCTMTEDKGFECTLTRRRSSARSAANMNRGAMESIMLQILKQAEFLRVKEEKRIKEQERKEAEEANQKEMEEWDKSFLALAAPSTMETMWEIPAIGHFLCLAQQILNLPEIVYYELERCLLMPQCSVFLSKIMTSLLSPPHRRPTLHRRPSLPYRAWEAALKQKVQQWYMAVGQADNPDRAAEKLGLCTQFFKVLGEVNPLEHKTFHELSFQQKAWLLKGLCDFVYETQSEVQDAVLGQPIHECREVILGYDTQENAYIHFPQFCGADVRVYRQRPYKAPEFPIPSIKVKRIPKCCKSKSKCKSTKKNNGELKSRKPVVSAITRSNVEHYDDHSLDGHMDSCESGTELKEVKHPNQSPCRIEAPSRGDGVKQVGYGGPLSPGEIRILSNVDGYSEPTRLETDTCSIKENALKSVDGHMNGNHTNNTDVICHQLALDVDFEDSVLDQEKLQKLQAKKKKKKKKNKDILSENGRGRCESLQHTFKSFKTEMHNKLYLNKKRAKHKKHKSGKKFISTNMIVKKKKRVASAPTVPEFQLVCTNLDELRELIKKVDEELKSMDNNKKKSVKGKWHARKQGVKELLSTLTRLLNELLPWEPKLLKAFQRNRARLKKDYDELQKLPESEKFTRESREECKPSKSLEPAPKTCEPGHKEVLKKECDDELEQKVTGMGSLLKKDHDSNCLSNSPFKNCKRQNQPAKVILPQKKIKLSTLNEGALNIAQQPDVETPERGQVTQAATKINVFHAPKPIQALLAKNIGNKVTLTSQQCHPIRTPAATESTNIASSPTSQSPVKSLLSSQIPLKAPLHMVYKLPDGQCLPIDLQNSSLKIQLQPVIDPKTGDRLTQQVLVLPKNIFIQQAGDKTAQEIQSTQLNLGKHLVSAVAMPTSSTDHFNSKTAPLPLSKTAQHSNKNVTLPITQPLVSAVASSTSISNCETSMSGASKFPASQVLSSHKQPIHSDTGSVTSSTGSPNLASQTASSTSEPQRDVSEVNQELKTVCIRDSQSILVRTRGGNTGVVKVQTTQDQGNSAINPSPIFTFTPQLQSFLVPRTKPSTPSMIPPPLSQPTSLFSKVSTVSAGVHQFSDSNTNSTQVQQTTAAPAIKAAGNSVQPNFLTSLSATNTLPFVSSQFNKNSSGKIALSPTCSSSVQQAGAILKQTETKTSSVSVVQPDSTTPLKSDLASGAPVHHPPIMLFTAPPINRLGNSTDKSMVASPTKTAGPSKNLVFINTQLPNCPSSGAIVQPTSKQAFFGKPSAKPTLQPQILFIPSTMTSPVKISSPSIVSQVKDVKIGLTIGHTIVNNTGGMTNIVPINIMPNALGKGNHTPRKDLPVSVASTFSKMQTNEQVTSSNIACDYNATTIKKPNAAMVVTSASSALGDDLSLSNRSSISVANTGSTVAISTVKTGHLSSSVLFSNTQMTSQAKRASSLQLPVTPTLLGTTSRFGTAPVAALKENEMVQSLSRNILMGGSTNVSKPQTATALSSGSTLVKAGHWHAASDAVPPSPTSGVNQVKPLLNEASTLQKLVINTSTPLAAGTQITINGTQFIVPPQGLGAGSHMLLLSSSTKQGPPLVGSVQTGHGFAPARSTPTPANKQSSSVTRPLVPPCTNVYSTSKTLPVVQAASQTVSTPASDLSSRLLSATALHQPLLVSNSQGGIYPQPTNTSQVSRGVPITAAGVLNSVSPPCNLLPTSFPENKMADAGTFRHQSSAADKPHTVAT